MIAVAAGPARQARLLLPPNRSMLDAVAEALAPLGWPSATLQILGGPMARAVYTCSVLTPGGPNWINYGPKRDLGPCWLAAASATFGQSPDGPALHCHAILAAPDCSCQGGHLVPQDSILSDEPLIAHAISAEAGLFHIVHDSGFNLLQPAPC